VVALTSKLLPSITFELAVSNKDRLNGGLYYVEEYSNA